MKRDVNYRSIADQQGYTLADEVIDPRADGLSPAQFDDLLKLSHARDVLVQRCTIRGGGEQRENAVDLNRNCRNIVLADCVLEAGRQNALTIKGGCELVTVARVTIEGAGGNCDIELGNWSDQSTAPVRGVRLLDVRRSDGRPVRLRVGRAEMPRIEGGNVRLDRLGSLRLKTYWWGKYIARNLFP